MAAKTLSQAQLNQRRAAGLALAAKVHPDYYRFIGSLGGRQFMANHYERVAARNQHMPRTQARQRAKADYYRPDTGTRVMLALFAPDTDTGKKESLRKLEAKELSRLARQRKQVSNGR